MVPLTFNEPQRIVHEKLADQYKRLGKNRAIVLKARQEGVSTYTAARFFRRVHMYPNQEALVIADEKDRAQAIYSIYDRFANFLPPEVKPMVRYATKKTEMVFDNPDDRARSLQPGLGSRISVETANDTNAGRGETKQCVHASELAFWEKPEDVWISLSQAVPDDESEVIVESTANGVGNFFYEMWQMAEEGGGETEGSNGYLAIFLPWWIDQSYQLRLTGEQEEDIRDSLSDTEKMWMKDGIEFRGVRHQLSLGQIAWRRQTIREKFNLDERAFRQEYPATPEEAFLVTGDTFFDPDILEQYRGKCALPIMRGRIDKIGQTVMVKPSEFGYLRVWENPNKDSTYVIGADTATGRQVAARDASFADPDREKGGRDFSSADVFDVTNRKVVAQLHGRMAPEIFADNLALLGVLYSSKGIGDIRQHSLIAVEKNYSSGETVLRELQQRLRYPRLYYARQVNRRAEKVKEVLGWQTTVETRMPMLDKLASALREGTIAIPNKDTIKEMLTFVRGEDGKPQAQEGSHDDRVISLAIALFVSEQVSLSLPKNFHKRSFAKAGIW